MAATGRREVLQCFKKLHRISQKVFDGDGRAMSAAQLKINTEFKKYKTVNDNSAVFELLKLGNEVASVLSTNVVQAKKVNDGVYSLKWRDGLETNKNVPHKNE